MKVVLSKKGFDSGNSPKPILIADNELLFLPIPSNDKTDKRYSEVFINDLSLSDCCRNIGIDYIYINDKKVQIDEGTTCHLDPQLLNYFGNDNFKGSFGQVLSAQTHLKNNNVQVGDLFLFYGWYKDLNDNIHKDGKNTIFGYLQIGEILKVNELTPESKQDIINRSPWLRHHPHWHSKETNNTIYIARENCTFDNKLNGYGMFKYSPELNLSANDIVQRTYWSIPELKGLKVSYKGANGKREFDELWQYRIFARCQELVIEESPQAEQWAINLIKQYAKR